MKIKFNLIPRLKLSNRGKILLLLPLPFFFAFFLSFITPGLYDDVKEGEFYFWVYVIGAAYTHGCLLYLPAYLVAYGWYCWKSKFDLSFTAKRLFWIPVISSAAMIYFLIPMSFIPKITFQTMVVTFLYLAGISLIVGYVWIGIVTLIFYMWRNTPTRTPWTNPISSAPSARSQGHSCCRRHHRCGDASASGWRRCKTDWLRHL